MSKCWTCGKEVGKESNYVHFCSEQCQQVYLKKEPKNILEWNNHQEEVPRDFQKKKETISSSDLQIVHIIDQNSSGYSLNSIVTRAYGSRTLLGYLGMLFLILYALIAFGFILGSFNVLIVIRIMLLLPLTGLVIVLWKHLSTEFNLTYYKMTFEGNSGKIVARARGLAWGNVWRIEDPLGENLVRIDFPLFNIGKKFNFSITTPEHLYSGIYDSRGTPPLKVRNYVNDQIEYLVQILSTTSKYVSLGEYDRITRRLKLTIKADMDPLIALLTTIVCIHKLLPTRISRVPADGG
jgi:endogenous inhibitor of DNA gyrase (YacG/DUF329 family)